MNDNKLNEWNNYAGWPKCDGRGRASLILGIILQPQLALSFISIVYSELARPQSTDTLPTTTAVKTVQQLKLHRTSKDKSFWKSIFFCNGNEMPRPQAITSFPELGCPSMPRDIYMRVHTHTLWWARESSLIIVLLFSLTEEISAVPKIVVLRGMWAGIFGES